MKLLGIKNYGSIPHLSSSKLGKGDYFTQEGQERILMEEKRHNDNTVLVF